MRLKFVLFALLLSGCTGAKVRPDPSEAAMPRNYPTLEFYACGQHFVGLGRCLIPEGQDASSVALAIQGYYAGQIRVFSETLAVDYSFAYRGTEKFQVPLSGSPDPSALVGFVMSPTYPGQFEEPIDVHPVIGFLLIEVQRPGERWDWSMTKTPAGTDAFLDLDTRGADEIFVVSPECGVDKSIPVTEETTRVRLSSLVLTAFPGRCIFRFVILDHLVTWMSWRYQESFRPLAVPALEIRGEKLRVTGAPEVSVISMDEEWYIDNSAKFHWDPASPHILRLLTVKGRIAVGTYSPETKGWVWKR